jgi:hypothetical protein
MVQFFGGIEENRDTMFSYFKSSRAADIVLLRIYYDIKCSVCSVAQKNYLWVLKKKTGMRSYSG